MEQRRQQIRSCITEVDQGDGVVILTDILGGTPSNLAISLCDKRTTDVIAGVNLPLLVKLAKIRSAEPLAEAVTHAAAAGRKYIAAASDMPGLAPQAKANGVHPPEPVNDPAPGETPQGRAR